MIEAAPMDAATKDEICFQLMKRVRIEAMRRGIPLDQMTDEQKFSVFRRHFRSIRATVEKGRP